MKIITLIEDKLVSTKSLYTEHGLSIYIEIDGKSILFDTGQTGKFIENAKKLGVNLKNLDYVIISHGHFDHSGGIKRLIEEINPNIKLIIGRGFFNEKYDLKENGDYKFTGNEFDEEYLKENNIEIEYADKDIINITENLMIFTNVKRDKAFENTDYVKFVKEDGGYKVDEFLEEISIGIKTDKGLLVIVGCSHVGIVNILNTIVERTGMNIYAAVGGTHLLKEDEEKINKVIKDLKEKNIELIGFSHCTGEKAETMINQQLGEYTISNKTGDILKV